MACQLNPVDQPVPPWEMVFWNDEWALHIVLPLIIVVQYFCGRVFGLFHNFDSLSWLASFIPTCMLSHPHCCAVTPPCGSGALLSCYAVMLSFFPPFFFVPSIIFLIALLVNYSFWLFFLYLILRFLLAIFRGVCNRLFDTVYLQPGALSIRQSYVISRIGLIFLTTCTLFYQ
jgi:hypothetical protein